MITTKIVVYVHEEYKFNFRIIMAQLRRMEERQISIEDKIE